MRYFKKTGITYGSNPEKAVGLLQTRNGYEQFVIKPVILDLSWVAVNNSVSKGDSDAKRN